MARISIVVKSQTAEQAMDAADQRGVKFMEAEHKHGSDTSVLWAHDDQLAAIVAWFADTPTMIAGFGYPSGTCLIYSFHKDAL